MSTSIHISRAGAEGSDGKREEEELRRRDAILEAVGFIAERFLREDNWEESINDALARLGRAADVSRVYIFENRPGPDGEVLTSQRYEWVAPGIAPQIDNPDLQDFPLRAAGFARWIDELSRGALICGHVRDFPISEHDALMVQNILSIAVVPIFVEQQWWGFIGFDACAAERAWSTAETDALRIVARILGAAIQHEKMQAALRESEERFRRLAEHAQDLIYRYEFVPRRGFTYVSPAATPITGYTPEEHYADPDLGMKIVHPDDLPLLEQYFQGGGVFSDPLVLRWRRKNGEIIWTEQRNVPIYDAQGNLIAIEGIARDITERKRAEAALHDTLAELRRSNADLEQFAHVASHDLQEPLRMVIGFLDLLAERYRGRLDRDAEEFIGFAVDGARRMQNLINALLDYARVGTRGQERRPVDANCVLEEALWNLDRAIVEAGATVMHDPLPAVLADPTQLMQLFQNLIGNAIKFRRAEPPVVHISAQPMICPETRIAMWEFQVRDNGIGIAAEDIGRIFGLFERLHTRQEYPGEGIGLAMCKKIVERHGGRIWVESVPGQGSTFHFTLPAAEQR